MSLKSFNSSRIVGYYVFILICILPLFFFPFSKSDAFRMPKFSLWIAALFITMLLILIGRLRSKRQSKFESQREIIIILGLYILAWSISTIFSVDTSTSLTGYPLYNGLLQLLMSIITFLLVVNYFQFKLSYMKYVLFVYCIISVYCIIQFYGVDPFVNYYGENVRNYSGQVFATVGNQNQVATCLSVVFVISAFLYILSEGNKNDRKMYFVTALIIFAGNLATSTRGGWLSAACSFIIAIPYLIKHPVFLKRYAAMCFACGIVFLVIDFSSGGFVSNRLMSMLLEGKGAISGNLTNEMGSRRMEIWLNSIDLVKNYWLIGSGPNTFPFVYNHLGINPKYVPDDRLIFLSPHNESLRLLITTGIFSLILYWVLVITIIKNGIRKANANILIVPFLLGLVCYLIKGMLNCSVVTDMAMFWVLLALIYNFKMYDHLGNKNMIKAST